MNADADRVSVLADVRLADGRAVDIAMRGGRIADIAPGLAADAPDATRIEGAGLLALPGLIDGHVHLDKTLTGLPWMPHGAGPERMSRIENDKTLRGALPPVTERAANLVRRCIAFGTSIV